MFTHFPKDRNFDVYGRTQITWDLCRKRTGNPIKCAEKFGDLITADDKVVSEECKSRNSHACRRCSRRIWPLNGNRLACAEQKTSYEQRLQKNLEPKGSPKLVYTGSSLEFGQAFEDQFWNHCTSTPHRSDTKGIAERAVRWVKEGTSAILLQSGLDEPWSAVPKECCCNLRNVLRPLVGQENSLRKATWRTIWWAIKVLLGQCMNVIPSLRKTSQDATCLVKRSYQANLLDMRLSAGRIWNGDVVTERLRVAGKSGRVRHPCSRTQRKGGSHAKKWRRFRVPFRRWFSQVGSKRSGIPEKSTFREEHPCMRRGAQRCFSRRVGRVSEPSDHTDDAEARDDFWSIFLVVTFIVIALNQELNSTCRQKGHFQYHSSTFDVRRTTTTL